MQFLQFLDFRFEDISLGHSPSLEGHFTRGHGSIDSGIGSHIRPKDLISLIPFADRTDNQFMGGVVVGINLFLFHFHFNNGDLTDCADHIEMKNILG